jgi:hypothetical protein
VLDAQLPAVQVFGPDGTHRTTFGRGGDGPGEFRDPNGIRLTPKGHILVSDPRNQRISRFTPEGDFLEAHTVPVRSFGFQWEGILDGGGRVLDQQFAAPLGQGPLPGRILRRIDLQTGAMDTLPFPPLPDGAGRAPVAWRFERGSTAIPFSAGGIMVLDPTGEMSVWLGWSDRYALARVSLEGDTLQLLEAGATPVPVSPQEREEAIAGVREFVAGIGAPPPDFGEIPSVKPLLTGLDVDPSGRLWVQLQAPDGGMRFDIFGPDGRWQGSAASSLPLQRFAPRVVEEDRLTAVVADSLGVAYVVRMRLQSGG